ncbi:phage shock protein C [Aequitasia blattaphilus]|uniref:PspC domain-containing protein n=1 Tax=Aequitasia blattaphilus TaxID=2949332 RepID=A0ABT1E9X2_9FIRM|nr:PspC domain-containing protein [Aequitasia blattaphilus]MCP1102625.1 PspC domain-containing protein [Aequitasia blattaphilus]MCR8615265.1 PspC domain-containing protein [Aequitasia blattaphilus]
MEPRKLYRSRRDRQVCGVCGGIAEYFNVDSTLIRLGAVLGAFVSCGTVVLAYFLAAIIIPDYPMVP